MMSCFGHGRVLRPTQPPTLNGPGTLIVVESSSAASRNKRQQHSSYDYDYGNYYDSQGGDSYSNQVAYDVPVEDRKCYYCEYTVLADQNHEEGEKECMEPFAGEGKVTELECEEDEPCMKKYEYKGKNSFTYRRGCLRNCKERSAKDGSYTLCCTGNLCNGFSSSYVIRDQRWLLIVGCLFSVLAYVTASAP